jgi:small subunit ribosomal protein S15
MALQGDVKKSVIGKYQLHDKDSGSPEVQIALLNRIEKYRELIKELNIRK